MFFFSLLSSSSSSSSFCDTVIDSWLACTTDLGAVVLLLSVTDCLIACTPDLDSFVVGSDAQHLHIDIAYPRLSPLCNLSSSGQQMFLSNLECHNPAATLSECWPLMFTGLLNACWSWLLMSTKWVDACWCWLLISIHLLCSALQRWQPNKKQLAHDLISHYACRDLALAPETCEELFTPAAPHIFLALSGIEVFSNGSGSHHQVRQ